MTGNHPILMNHLLDLKEIAAGNSEHAKRIASSYMGIILSVMPELSHETQQQVIRTVEKKVKELS